MASTRPSAYTAYTGGLDAASRRGSWGYRRVSWAYIAAYTTGGLPTFVPRPPLAPAV